MHLKIALLQLLPENSLSRQLEKGKEACIRAKEMGADIALFPEMWSDGYALPQDSRELNALAISKDDGFVHEFRELAVHLQMAVGITFLEQYSPRPLNSLILFDGSGKERIHYSKVHTCDFDREKVLSSGDGFHVADLDIGTTILFRYPLHAGFRICRSIWRRW